MKRAHAMPFGAALHGHGTAFRLWAPGVAHVDLVLDGSDATARRMQVGDDGWHELVVPEARAGTRYAFRLPDGLVVPDPASRANPDGVHAPSMVVDPLGYDWKDTDWRGRPWSTAVIYELHVGTFTPEGTYAAAAQRLPELAALGITAIELMPLAAFPGTRNWGYDGVLQFAPAAAYGTPDELKRLVDAAHAAGLMVLLDVVYNHFGPEGNYLHAYAPQFFNPRHQTPWGAGINFDGERRDPVRSFYVHNALYWLEEFHFDGLRMDAIHAIADDSDEPIAAEIARRVRERFEGSREVHVVLENDRNDVSMLRREHGRPTLATAQWNDDAHHALHVLATGEREGYYADYADAPLQAFGRALAEGFIFQGQPSPFRGGARRGMPSTALPPVAFVNFAQNHDQIGNRALGERLTHLADAPKLRALVACLLVAPAPPLLFMGDEFGATTPFLFFCDFGPELADAVRKGRREEFASFPRFRDREAQARIPDPNLVATYERSKLDWNAEATPRGADWRAFYARCLAYRHAHVEPFARTVRTAGTYAVRGDDVLHVAWRADDARALHLVANLGRAVRDAGVLPAGERFVAHGEPVEGEAPALPPFTVVCVVAHG
jgi:maltooligosyltrehalose trehalohydrolase